MNKTEKLKTIYNLLKTGVNIQIQGKKGGVIVWRGIGNRGDREYLFWQSYGSSANRLGIKNLRFIAKIIGESSTYNFRVVNGIYSVPLWYE